MKVLLINSNITDPFCAVYNGSDIFISYTSEFITEKIQAEKKPDKLALSLRKAAGKLSLNDIDVISVNCGPGSFTSIRVGIALAKGVNLALGKPVIAINDFDILFDRFEFPDNEKNFLVLIPSKLPEFYYSHRTCDQELSRGFININEISSVFPQDPLLVADFDNESVKNLNYFSHLEKYVVSSAAGSMLRIAQGKFNRGETSNASEIDPLYIRDFIVRKPV